jgi:hypothetical protein
MGDLFSNKAFFLGFGAMAALVSVLPLSSPFLVVGATRAHLALAARGHIGSTLNSEERARLISGIKTV